MYISTSTVTYFWGRGWVGMNESNEGHLVSFFFKKWSFVTVYEQSIVCLTQAWLTVFSLFCYKKSVFATGIQPWQTSDKHIYIVFFYNFWNLYDTVNKYTNTKYKYKYKIKKPYIGEQFSTLWPEAWKV